MDSGLERELTDRLRSHKTTENHETIAIRITRELIPVLTKYRGKVVGSDGKKKAESWGAVAENLIRAADEMLEARAGASEQRGGAGGTSPSAAETAKPKM